MAKKSIALYWRILIVLFIIYIAGYAVARQQGCIKVADFGVFGSVSMGKPKWRAKPLALFHGREDKWQQRYEWFKCKFEDGIYYIYYPVAKLECRIRQDLS